MAQERLRVAVVGAGVGAGHVDVFKKLDDLFEVVAICDIDKDKAKTVAIKSGMELPVTLDDGRNSIELVTAIYLSAQTGRPVNLPLRPGDPGYGGWMGWMRFEGDLQ